MMIKSRVTGVNLGVSIKNIFNAENWRKGSEEMIYLFTGQEFKFIELKKELETSKKSIKYSLKL